MVVLHLSLRVLFLCQLKNTRNLGHRLYRQCYLPDYSVMSSDVDGKTRFASFLRRISIKSANLSMFDSSGSSGHGSGEQDEYLFSSPNISPTRRPSTFDDERSVKNLLKEILAFKDTNVSSWLVENKVKNLCAAYNFLLKPHKAGFLKELSLNYAVDHNQVTIAAKSLGGVDLGPQEGDQRAVIKCEERLKDLLTPQYSWLFMHMGRLERGVKFLVDLRTDVLSVIADTAPTDPSLVPLQQLNLTLRDMLSLWFTVGFLNLERVTWRSPCEMLQKISEYEAVHPMRSWTDLKRRVGPYRRCFVYTHSSMPDEPLVVLHTALSDEIAGSMKGIVAAASRMSVDIASCPGLSLESQTEDPACVKAAIFYSITSTQRGLQGIELGNYLIKRVVRELQAEFPLVDKFSSLSPIPTFHAWFLDRLKHAEKSASSTTDLLTRDEVDELTTYLRCDNVWSELRRLLKNNSWVQDAKLAAMLETPLMRLCVRYLYLEKRRGFALDSVANFHLRNGAMMWRINWKADWSPRGLGNSCGIMVNYRYFLDSTELNSHTYLGKQVICASEGVQQVALQASNLMEKFASKM